MAFFQFNKKWAIAGIGIAVVGGAFLLYWVNLPPSATFIDPANPGHVMQGKAIYAYACAACHGAKLQGQPRWRERLANGRLPAPPHDDTGHTWHHPDAVLFEDRKSTRLLQSLMRISYAVFCLKKKTTLNTYLTQQNNNMSTSPN